MESIDDKILAIMKRKKAGHIFVFNDFAHLGTANAVRVALHRLVKKGIIHRITPGLFVLPKTSKLFNKEILPAIESVAQAIARRDKAKIIPTGVFALNALGLSTQVPLNIVYFTNGRDRKVKIENYSIRFKKTSLKKIALKGKISRLVILAMTEIGKGKLTQDEIDKISNLLKKEDIDNLRHDLALAPQWVAETINKAMKK